MQWDEKRPETETGVCCHLMVNLKQGRPYAREGQSQWNVRTIVHLMDRQNGKTTKTNVEQGSGPEMTEAWDRR